MPSSRGTEQADGYGYRDLEKRLPVTPDSLFGIGSCTKAFTGAAAVLSAEAGKLSLEDSPKKFLPYFRLPDPTADAQVTLKDLLTHRTGLTAFDDEVWHKNDKLSREEVIKAVMSKPATAKFRTAFQYNNVMYSAVGECIGRANDSTWEGVISNRIFEPLGMKTSNTSLQEMHRSADYTIGYHLPGRHPFPEKTHDLYNVAASGGINSSARDLTRWIQLMLGQGVFEGKRLVSDAGFRQLITPANGHYALGWEVIDVDGHTILISEGGAVGHAARVTIDLDAHTGWALLANVNNVREFRQMANIVELSLRPMPDISRWIPAANVIAFLLWLTTLGSGVGAVVLSKRRGQQSKGRSHNYPIGLPIRRRLPILLAAVMLICASVALHNSMINKPWLIVHLPALESIKLGMLCCGFVVLATGFARSFLIYPRETESSRSVYK